ncbi:MAG TPA: TetR/AcrR family transcriptional regulator [Bryobacteraceae bacterium]|nr:TetR/AcrR family transcriptional regulator [Bryobacteraceae bacterium]
MPSPPFPKQRMSSGQRRAAIVDAAVQLFAQNGFRGTTTRQIAAAVGVSEPVLYMHFQTKRDLYSAIIEKMAGGALGEQHMKEMAAIAGTRDDERFFRYLAHEMLKWHEEEPARMRILLFSALEGHELSEMFYQRHVVSFLESFASYIRSRIEDGAFRPVDPLPAAKSFCGMITSYAERLLVFSLHEPDALKDQTVDTMISIYLNGLRQPNR